MKADAIDPASPVLNILKELGHPIEIPDDCRTANGGTTLRPREYILHVKVGGIRRGEVGLARDVGFINAQEIFGLVLVHLTFNLIPEVLVLRAPIHGYPLDM